MRVGPRLLAVVGLVMLGCSDPSPTLPSPQASMAVTRERPALPAASAKAPPVRPSLNGRAFPDKVLALTWDDGPDANTVELARFLHDRHVAGTFFVVSEWVDGISAEPGLGNHPFDTGYSKLPILGALVALGHRLGNHTRNHVLLSQASQATVQAQLSEAQDRINPFITNELALFRAPGGAWNAAASSAVDGDPATAALVGPFGWDIDQKDWEGSLYCRSDRPRIECERASPRRGRRVTAEVTAARYVANVEAVGHGIVLMHDRVGDVGSRYAVEVAARLIPALQRRGYVFAAPVLQFSSLTPRMQRGGQGASVGPFDSDSGLHLADIDGDGLADVCERTPLGLVCAAATRAQPNGYRSRPLTVFDPPTLRAGPLAGERRLGLADVNGDGKADLCVLRGPDVACALANEIGFGAFETPAIRAGMGAWGSVQAIRLADLDGDGKSDVCGWSPEGIRCALRATGGFEPSRLWLQDPIEPTGFLAPGMAFELADVDGDGRADVCWRATNGISCALSIVGGGFGEVKRWSQADDFRVARFRVPILGEPDFDVLGVGDLNGDGRADVCSPGPSGVMCALSTGEGFTGATNWLPADRGDARGWFADGLSGTLLLGDINGDGRADLCGRGRTGVVCALAP